MDRSALVDDAAAALGVAPDEVERSLEPVAEPFGIIGDGLRRDARLTADGAAFTHRWLVRLLVGRFHLDRAASLPGVVDDPVVAPVVVAGAPRTGTTYLHGLLAQHPQLRAPRGWELLYPAPPPDPEPPDDDPRLVAADEELTWPQRRREEMLSIHRYAARMHKECLSAMSFAFHSEEFVSRYRLPAYVDWLRATDPTPAYEIHRLVLQCLQHRQDGPTRWVLKSPVHLNNLPTLLATYPDALVVITHRDPAAVLGSVTSLVATLRQAFSDDVDEEEIGRYHLDLYGRTLDALAGAARSDRVVHVGQRELITDPQRIVDAVLARAGLPTTTLDTTPPAETGRHDYALVGATETEVEAAFARYRAVFAARL
jgi:hypothetical protein